MFNGPTIVEGGKEKESLGCGSMEVTGLLCQSSCGRVARKEIRLLLSKSGGERGGEDIAIVTIVFCCW